MASPLITSYLEDFIRKQKTEFTNLLDIGCCGSEYEDYIAGNISEYDGCDILLHHFYGDLGVPLQPVKHKHIQRNFRYFPAKPRYHLVTCVDTLHQFGVGSYSVEQPHKEIVHMFQKMYLLAMSGLFLTFKFGHGGIAKDRFLQISPTIVDAMLTMVPPKYVDIKYVHKDQLVSFAHCMLLPKEDSASAILTIDKTLV